MTVSDRFRALMIDTRDGVPQAFFTELSRADLPEEDVLIDVAFSTLNYKDGLAITGKAPICKRLPMVGGVDLAGTVVESRVDAFRPGDRVALTGGGLSEDRWGGYAEYERVPADYLVKIPDAFSLEEAMAIGSAGYTAMLCVMALEDGGLDPASGEIVVTGASGGVGSVAVALLSDLGYRVVAVTGRPENADYLGQLGAARVIDRADAAGSAKTFQSQRWAGAVDTVGGAPLAHVLAQIQYHGCVAACGLAAGADLPASVLPFILRGVRLQGVESVYQPGSKRDAAWERLARDLDKGKLAAITTVAPMSDLPDLAEAITVGRVRGRIVIDVSR